jgi:peptide/nickel transport system ATP-binding protein
MTQPLLDIHNLTIATQPGPTGTSDEILKGVNLTLNPGEVVGLIGESGAGKSTLGLAAMGYARRGLYLSGGEIFLDGQELRCADKESLRRLRGRKVAYVAQSAAAAFNPAQKLLAQVLEVTHIHQHLNLKEAESQAVNLFLRMGLPDPQKFGDRYPHEVSGGQLQRAMTAMALVGKPDLIVFDEPTTALDVTTQIDVLAIIKEVIAEFGTAALYITHDIAVVSQVSDRIKVLRNGEEVEEQPTQDLLNRPREAYTRALLGAREAGVRNENTADSDSILSVRNVTAGYGSVNILYNVSIELRKGYNLAIVGESGSGKSTLARVITGLLPPAEGEVILKGHALSPDLAGRSAKERKIVQLIYQQPDVAMNPRQTISEIVGRPAQVFVKMTKSASVERAKELLELVDLKPELADRYPGQLSGGQKQRVCIARALAADPELIICDEVTSALDPLVADEIIKLLLRLQSRLGVSYIFITHDMGMVRSIADDVVVMQNGKIVEQGAKKEIFAPPFADYTHLLISSTPKTEEGWLEQVIASRRMASAGN